MRRACSECGRPTTGSRCPNHPRPVAQRNQKLRALIAASAPVCPKCGRIPTLNNPMTADHRVAQLHGGQDTEQNLRPLCRSCNSRAGQALNA